MHFWLLGKHVTSKQEKLVTTGSECGQLCVIYLWWGVEEHSQKILSDAWGLNLNHEMFYVWPGNSFGSWSLSFWKTCWEEKRNLLVYHAACQAYLEFLAQIAELLPSNCPVGKPVQPRHPFTYPPMFISPVLGTNRLMSGDSPHVYGDGESDGGASWALLMLNRFQCAVTIKGNITSASVTNSNPKLGATWALALPNASP